MRKIINKDIIYLIIVIILINGYFITQLIVPNIKDLFEKKDRIFTKLQQIETERLMQATRFTQIKQGVNKIQVYEKKPKMHFENATADLLEELIFTVRETKNKITKISLDDNQTNLASLNNINTHTIKVNLSLNTNYQNLKNLIESLLKWKYIVGINSISAINSKALKFHSTKVRDPDKYLDADLVVYLYIKK